MEVYLRDEVSDRSLNLTATCCSRGMLKFENDTVDNLLVYFSTCGLTRNTQHRRNHTQDAEDCLSTIQAQQLRPGGEDLEQYNVNQRTATQAQW